MIVRLCEFKKTFPRRRCQEERPEQTFALWFVLRRSVGNKRGFGLVENEADRQVGMWSRVETDSTPSDWTPRSVKA